MPTDATIGTTLGTLLTVAWLLPLVGFAVEIFGGFWGTRKSKAAAYLAVACIGTSFLLSAAALVYWGQATDWAALKSHDAADSRNAGQPPGDAANPAAAEHAAPQAHVEPGAHTPAAGTTTHVANSAGQQRGKRATIEIHLFPPMIFIGAIRSRTSTA